MARRLFALRKKSTSNRRRALPKHQTNVRRTPPRFADREKKRRIGLCRPEASSLPCCRARRQYQTPDRPAGRTFPSKTEFDGPTACEKTLGVGVLKGHGFSRAVSLKA